jgi:hypothetical protein
LFLNNRVKALDKYNEYGIEPVEIDIKKCIKYVAHAWNNVTESTIKNCWRKTGILPKTNDNTADEINLDDTTVEMNMDEIIVDNTNELNEVQALIDKLNLGNSLNADEFIDYDNTVITTEIRTNDEILAAVLPNNENEIEDDSNPLPIITHNEAIESYDKIILYLEQQEENFDTKKDEIKYVKKLKKEAIRYHFFSMRQSNLDSFIEDDY